MDIAEKLRTATFRRVKQSEMSAECWVVQFGGLASCERCEFKNTKDCGGKKIRKTGKNKIGKKVPIGEEAKCPK